MYSYSWVQWLFFFYLYCFFGWIWESCYVSVRQKRWVNRGFLHLPMLPIYGSGAIVVLFVSLPLRGHYLLEYLAGAAAATLLELVVGLAMEAVFKVKYWDYSSQKIQYKGVICLSSTLFWGVLSIFLTEAAQKPLERFVFSMPEWFLYGAVGIISVLFVYDTVISVKAALDLAKVLTAMEQAKKEMEEEAKALEARAKAAMEEAVAAVDARLDSFAGAVDQRLEDIRTSVDEKLSEASLEAAVRREIRRENREAGVAAAKARTEEWRQTAEARTEEWKQTAEARTEEWKRTAEARTEEWKRTAEARSEEWKQTIEERRIVREARMEELLEKAYRVSKGAARRNPGMTSRRFRDSLEKLKEKVEERR